MAPTLHSLHLCACSVCRINAGAARPADSDGWFALACLVGSMDEISSGFYRSRLSSAISKDSGETWEHFRTLVACEGIQSIARVDAGPPGWLLSSGAVPHDLDLIPAAGFRSVRAPRASVEGGVVFFVFDDRLYVRKPVSPRGWERIQARHRLRAVPVAWFYGQDG